MRTIALAALLLTFGTAAEAQRESAAEPSDSLERSFLPGGTVRLDLSAGDYKLTSGADNRIRIVWRTRDVEALNQARVRATIRGREAAIMTSRPHGFRNNHFRVDIELPRRSDVQLRMTAGDLSIAGIEGHKDVLLRAGDLTIEVANPEQYGKVNASVTAGDLLARPFGFSTGGLFRNFAHTGPGRYQLRARLWAGDLKILPARLAVK